MICSATGCGKWSGPPSLRTQSDPDPNPQSRVLLLSDTGEESCGTREKQLPSESGAGPYLPCMRVHFYTILQYADDEPEVRQAGPGEA